MGPEAVKRGGFEAKRSQRRILQLDPIPTRNPTALETVGEQATLIDGEDLIRSDGGPATDAAGRPVDHHGVGPDGRPEAEVDSQVVL